MGEYDGEIGLHNYRARLYHSEAEIPISRDDSDLGRFYAVLFQHSIVVIRWVAVSEC